jgi:hypothetical protein
MEAHTLRPVIGARHGFADAPDAFRTLEAGNRLRQYLHRHPRLNAPQTASSADWISSTT